MTNLEAVTKKNIQFVDTPFKPTVSPAKKFLHKHPLILKTAIPTFGALALGMVYSGLKNRSISTTILGAILSLTSYAANKVYTSFYPPTFDPAKKAFKCGECEGVTLTYDGDLALLTIPKNVPPFKAGYGRGFLMAEAIKEIWGKNDFVLHAFPFGMKLPRHKQIPDLMNKMKEIIPAEFVKEMEGLVAGYNEKRKTWSSKGKELALEDVIYFSLLPDALHLDFKQANNWLQRNPQDLKKVDEKNNQEGVMGCSVVVDGNATTGPRAIRTVDWVTQDTYGKYAFVELRETVEGMRFAGQSLPLFVGSVTAMNEHGLCVAMNVARGLTDYPQRMPAVFYLRKLIETCTSVKGEKGAEKFWQTNSPLGPFNLSVIDEHHAAGVHFYQKDDKGHNVRWWKEGGELVTLNFRYGEKGETNPTMTNSTERKAEIENFYKKLRREGTYNQTDATQRLKSILKGPEVNNVRTASAAFFDSKRRIFETSFDNGYASDRPLLKVPVDTWFSRKDET